MKSLGKIKMINYLSVYQTIDFLYHFYNILLGVIIIMRRLTKLFSLLMIFSAFTIFNINIFAEQVGFSEAKILVSEKIASPVKETCLRVLQEEVEKRTSVVLEQTGNWSNDLTIALCLSSSEDLLGKKIPESVGNKIQERLPEGFRLYFNDKNGQKILWIIGADKRGVLFGIGEFLRRAEMSKNKILIETPLDFASSPAYPIRGHQLGYRNTANSYDAWSVKQYEQYIRELVLFGTNSIENIPLGGKGDESVHFKLPRKEMNVEISKICDAYDVDYWVWIPAQVDLSIDSLRRKEIEKHEAFYKATPRLNNVFFPGGDPGDNHPRDVMPFLKELHKRLVKYHPNAGIWISLQGFSEEQIDYFYHYLDVEKPDWLAGVVSGPSSPPIAETRFRLPKQYKHRQYPDITHNVRCEFPAPNFDQAFALTIGREGINPMPVYYAKIHSDYAQFTDGFVAYSDGCHDDVNKIVWSQRGWDPDKNLRDILMEYSRFFFGPELDISAAEGIFALERNWFGPLKDNGSVETTFAYWKDLEKKHPELSGNWRWLMLQLRADYDTYVRRRLINEKNLEKEANKILAQDNKLGIETAMERSLAKINEADTQPIEKELKNSIEKYCENLFNLIGLQTSVKLYNASGEQRGAILDFVDYPLNNRWWYADEFDKVSKLSSDKTKLEKLELMRKWENPDPGSYYDDVSNIANSPHVTTTVYDATDFGWLNGGFSRLRLSSQVYQFDPILKYENLDPNGRYIVRITGYGDALLRIDGQRLEPIIYNKEVEGFKEFVIPRNFVGDGKITMTFDQPEQSRINWRNYSRISDVWLIKK
ncbi:FIG01098537: hypothetical protein [hydrothermal vent metagenome]|uniref:Alpha glucuronidase N-terminal domain-containing protein n=1 Tax=hydrothermal vent metagenome TaxID=652676 RepID=A0A3B1CEP6_9ZZZZ